MNQMSRQHLVQNQLGSVIPDSETDQKDQVFAIAGKYVHILRSRQCRNYNANTVPKQKTERNSADFDHDVKKTGRSRLLPGLAAKFVALR